MQIERYLFHVLRVTFDSRVKFVDSKDITLCPPIACY